jgi:hypothetical protein
MPNQGGKYIWMVSGGLSADQRGEFIESAGIEGGDCPQTAPGIAAIELLGEHLARLAGLPEIEQYPSGELSPRPRKIAELPSCREKLASSVRFSLLDRYLCLREEHALTERSEMPGRHLIHKPIERVEHAVQYDTCIVVSPRAHMATCSLVHFANPNECAWQLPVQEHSTHEKSLNARITGMNLLHSRR